MLAKCSWSVTSFHTLSFTTKEILLCMSLILLSQYIARECEASYSGHVINISPGLRRSVKTAQESENTLFNAF